MADQGTSEPRMSEHLRQMLAGFRGARRPWLPKRLRGGEDVAASGGYMIACAADEIICDDSTIIGSIGVIGGSFGFSGLLEKLGIERRLYTSGERKAMLDPFLPEKPDDVERLKSVQRDIHDDFIALVKERRGARLTGPEGELFSGEYWTGRTAVELGLADTVGELRSILRE